MITTWSARNFKAISQASLDLGELNVILGKNSVGKSSLIQSIISASQYFENQYPSAKYSFIGNAQDLGPAALVQNRESKDRAMTLAFRFSQAPAYLDGVCELTAVLPKPDSDEMLVQEIDFHPSKTGALRGGRLHCDWVVAAAGRQKRRFSYIANNRKIEIDLGFSVMPEGSYRDEMLPSRLTGDAQVHAPAWLETHLLVLSSHFGANALRSKGRTIRLRSESMPSEVAILGEFLRAVSRCRAAKDQEASAVKSVPEGMKNPAGESTIEAALAGLLAFKAALDKAEQGYKSFLKQSEKRLKNHLPGHQLGIPASRYFSARDNSAPENPQLIWVGLVYLVALEERDRQERHPEFDYLFSTSRKATGEGTLDRFFSHLLDQARMKLARKVKYLGPMRAVHPSEQKNGRTPSQIIPIGRGGEYLAHYFHTHRAEIDSYCLPAGPKVTSLGKALDLWLAFFDIGKTSSTASSSWGASEYLLDGERTNQKGTGVSQILPVILVALMSKPGDLLILEQPELHLHPAHQRKLADLLVTFSEYGVQVIAETHSEYLVTRLRLLIATGKIQSQNAKIIFAESKGVGSKRQVRFKASSIDKIGQVGYWPDGFFEESLGDRLLLSSIQFAAEE